MTCPGISRGLRLFVVILFSTAQVDAADPLRLNLSPVTSSIRSDAPLSINVHLDWASVDLLEGRLELTCYDGEKLVHRSVSGEVALLAGDRRSRTVLPPMSLSEDLSTLTVKSRFLGESSNYDLGTFEFRVPVHWKRSFVIGIVHPEENAGGAGITELGNSIRLDRFGENEIRTRDLISIPSQVTPEDLRASGLGLFSFDLLVLSGPGFHELTPNQLDAIGDWVEAGGSLCVVVEGNTSAEEAKFLNRISGLPDNDPGMLFNADSLPRGSVDNRRENLRMYRPGLGRSVILQATEKVNALGDLPEAAGFLWKIRGELQSEIRDSGSRNLLSTRLTDPAYDQFGNWQSGRPGNSQLLYSPFQKVRLVELDSLTSILLPDDVRGIPLGVVVAILALFLTAIVPLDYFVLGHFNCRKFTWALVPIVSLGFTGFTTFLGNAYLGSTDYRTSLEFVDLTTGNRVIRSSRFEMLFTATQREAATELKQTLYAPVSVRRRTDVDQWNSAGGMMTLDSSDATVDEIGQPQDSDSSQYEGDMPTLFTVRQQMRKWSPQLSRQTALQTERPVPQVSLDDIATVWQRSPPLRATAEWLQTLRDRIQSAAPESTVLLFNRNQVLDLTEGKDLPDPDEQVSSAGTKRRRLVELVRKACVRPAVGMFSIVSQISPNGAGDFEDLSILDPADPDQLLLVIVTRQGNDYVVFRRLFHRGA